MNVPGPQHSISGSVTVTPYRVASLVPSLVLQAVHDRPCGFFISPQRPTPTPLCVSSLPYIPTQLRYLWLHTHLWLHTPRRTQTIDLSGQALSATLDYPIVCRLAAGNPRLARLRLSRAGVCGVTSGGRGRRSLVGLHSLALTLKVSGWDAVVDRWAISVLNFSAAAVFVFALVA